MENVCRKASVTVSLPRQWPTANHERTRLGDGFSNRNEATQGRARQGSQVRGVRIRVVAPSGPTSTRGQVKNRRGRFSSVRIF